MVPVDEDNTLNIKLFPTYPDPPPVHAYQVPLSIVDLEALTDANWDLTMLRILPFVDGVNSVKQISLRADADYKLVRKAIAHLLYYGCITLLDTFSFGASYAATAEMGAFVADPAMQEECRLYILLPVTERGKGEEREERRREREAIDGTRLVELYCSLRQGQSLRSWCMEHADVVGVMDVRRFITFGVIKGFLYRVHKYAIAIEAMLGAKGKKGEGRQGDRAFGRFLDGTHCFDEICTELGISERELLGRLKEVGDVQIIQK